MSRDESCLVQKLSHYVDLSGDDLDHLARLEDEEKPYPRGASIQAKGDPVTHLFVVKKGWVYSYCDLPDGRRQVVRIHHPGDLLGFPDIAFQKATVNLHTAEDVVLCPFPKAELDEIFEKSPRLTALLFSLSLREQASLIDMLQVNGRMNARERVAFLLLDLQARLRIANRHITDTFRLPISQGVIADAVGLTNVYVSKVMSGLEAEGLIERHDRMVRLPDAEALVRICDFVDRYHDLDTSWFPERQS